MRLPPMPSLAAPPDLSPLLRRPVRPAFADNTWNSEAARPFFMSSRCCLDSNTPESPKALTLTPSPSLAELQPKDVYYFIMGYGMFGRISVLNGDENPIKVSGSIRRFREIVDFFFEKLVFSRDAAKIVGEVRKIHRGRVHLIERLETAGRIKKMQALGEALPGTTATSFAVSTSHDDLAPFPCKILSGLTTEIPGMHTEPVAFFNRGLETSTIVPLIESQKTMKSTSVVVSSSTTTSVASGAGISMMSIKKP